MKADDGLRRMATSAARQANGCPPIEMTKRTALGSERSAVRRPFQRAYHQCMFRSSPSVNWLAKYSTSVNGWRSVNDPSIAVVNGSSDTNISEMMFSSVMNRSARRV